MAIDQGTATVAVTSQERTWRVNIETPLGADPSITIQREEVKTDPSGAVLSKNPNAVVSRGLSAIATEQFTVGSRTYTVAEIATVIAAIADQWRTEDLTAPQKPSWSSE
jgi:hypothetical protein